MRFRKAESNSRKKKLLVDTQHNNPVGADWRSRSLLWHRRSVAAQPERYTANKSFTKKENEMDPASITVVASAVVSLLSAFLKKFASDAAAGAAKEAGADSWAKAKNIYDSVKNWFSGGDASSLESLEQSPDDSDAKAAVQADLQKLMLGDEVIAKQLAALIKEADDAGVDTVFNTNIHGDVEKFYEIGVIHGGATFN
jgi:hypothetical protein